MPSKSFYYPVDLEDLWERFKNTAKREGRPVSYILVRFIQDYVRQHEPGNPQLRLDRVLEDGGPRGPVCDVCGAAAHFRILTKRGKIYRCKIHGRENPRVHDFISYREL